MELTFNLTDCVKKFVAFNEFRRVEISFDARPKSFAITTLHGVTIAESTNLHEEGTRIEIVFAPEDFHEKSHGFFSQVNDWGISIALSCSQNQMNDLINFIVHGEIPKQVNLELSEVNLIAKNFKMEKDEYKVLSWNFNL